MLKLATRKHHIQLPRYEMAALLSILCILLIIGVLVAQTNAISTTGRSKRTNPYGIAFSDIGTYDKVTLDKRLQDTATLGFQWIRIDFTWSTIEAHNSHTDDWSSTDRVVSSALAHHLQVLGVIDYTPIWARSTLCKTSPQCAPADVSQFASFAAKAAARYQNQVTHWEIWNEENIARFWQPVPNPADYTNLLKLSYTAIKRVVPNDFVMIGGLSSSSPMTTNIDAVTFLRQIYAYGGRSYFDAIAYHPYTFPDAPTEATAAWARMDEPSDSLATTLAEQGDSAKRIWITEFGAPTNGTGTHVSETAQANFIRIAVDDLKTKSWAGPLFWYTYADSPTGKASTNEYFYGLRRADGSPKPAYQVWQQILHD